MGDGKSEITEMHLTCGSHQSGRLPDITYASGGLENPDIRKQVCEILEGGETAFKERAKRLRIKM